MVSLTDDDVVGRDSGGEFGRGSEATGQAIAGFHISMFDTLSLFINLYLNTKI